MCGNLPSYKLMQQKHAAFCGCQNSYNWHEHLRGHWQNSGFINNPARGVGVTRLLDSIDLGFWKCYANSHEEEVQPKVATHLQIVSVPDTRMCGRDCKMCCAVCEWFEPKFVSFLRKHKRNCAHRVDMFFHVHKTRACCLQIWHVFNRDWSMFMECELKLRFVTYLLHICGKFIYCAPSANHTQTMQRSQGNTCVQSVIN